MDRETIATVAPFAVSGAYGLEGLHDLGRFVIGHSTPGDFVECGVARGGTAAMLAAALHDQPDRRLWLFDSFEGLPESSERDGAYAKDQGGSFQASVDDVYETLSLVQADLAQVRIVAGWFEATMTSEAEGPESVALLHIDADLFESVSLALHRFYDSVSVGGVIVLDDFGWYEGTRLAFYDFVEKRGLRPLVERFGKDKLFWVKGREHNRDSVDDLPVAALDAFRWR